MVVPPADAFGVPAGLTVTGDAVICPNEQCQRRLTLEAPTVEVAREAHAAINELVGCRPAPSWIDPRRLCVSRPWGQPEAITTTFEVVLNYRTDP